jgi:hypothetical protein
VLFGATPNGLAFFKYTHTHTQTHTHTHTHTHSLTHSLTHTRTHSLTHTHTLRCQKSPLDSAAGSTASHDSQSKLDRTPSRRGHSRPPRLLPSKRKATDFGEQQVLARQPGQPSMIHTRPRLPSTPSEHKSNNQTSDRNAGTLIQRKLKRMPLDAVRELAKQLYVEERGRQLFLSCLTMLESEQKRNSSCGCR